VMLIIGLGCGGASGPPGRDWIVGKWQMYACYNYATEEQVPVEGLGLSGEIVFRNNHHWESWRDGWPGGHYENGGKWSVATPGIYEIDPSHRFPNVYRDGDDIYSVGGLAGELWRFYYRRSE